MIASIFSRVAHLKYFSPELEGWAVSSYFLLSDHKEHKSDNSLDSNFVRNSGRTKHFFVLLGNSRANKPCLLKHLSQSLRVQKCGGTIDFRMLSIVVMPLREHCLDVAFSTVRSPKTR
jgi:hypothetical protein